MPDICQECIIQLLEENGFEPIHIDAWTENEVIYFYEPGQFRFSGSSLSESYAKKILKQFGLTSEFPKLLKEECHC